MLYTTKMIGTQNKNGLNRITFSHFLRLDLAKTNLDKIKVTTTNWKTAYYFQTVKEHSALICTSFVVHPFSRCICEFLLDCSQLFSQQLNTYLLLHSMSRASIFHKVQREISGSGGVSRRHAHISRRRLNNVPPDGGVWLTDLLT